MSAQPWRVVYSTRAKRRAILLALVTLPFLLVLTYNAMLGARPLGILLGAGVSIYLVVRCWRAGTVRVITDRDGVHVVNRWRSAWLPWQDIEGIEVDSLVISQEALNNMPDSFRQRFYRRTDVLHDDTSEGPRVVERARLRTVTGETVPMEAMTGESLLVVSQALLAHRSEEHSWPDTEDPFSPA